MPLILKSSAHTSSDCKSIIYKDLTGIESDSNPGGWGGFMGGPNNPIIIASNLIIKDSLGNVLLNIPTPSGLPTTDITFEYIITAAQLGGTVIADGLYIIEFTLLDGNGITIYTTGNRYFLFTCNLDCCVDKMFAKIAESDDCSCTSTVITNALYANALLKGLKALKNCGNISGMTSLITKLKTICGFTTSGCNCS